MLYFYLLLFILTCSQCDYITDQTSKSVPTANTAGTNFPKNIASDPTTENFYIAGSFSQSCDFGGTNLTAAAESSSYLAKYNSSLDLLWVVSPSGKTSFESIAVNSIGDIIAGGYQQGSVDYAGIVRVTNSQQDATLVKYSSNGSIQWVKTFGITGTHQTSFVSARGNSIAICTASYQTINFGGANISSVQYTDSAVAKFDSSGSHQFSFGFTGSDGWDDCGGLAIDSSDNLIVSFTSSSADALLNGTAVGNSGDRDIIVASFSGSGSLLWFKRFASQYAEGVYANGVDSSDNILITGFFGANITFGGPGMFDYTGYGAFLVKLNNTGSFLWQTSIQSVGNNFGKSIQTGLFNSVYLAGTYQGTPTCQNLTFPSASNGAFVSKFDSHGNILWYSTFNSSSSITDADAAIGPSLVYLSVAFSGDINSPTQSVPVYGSSNSALLSSISEFIPNTSPSATPSPSVTPSRTPTPSVTPSRTPSATPSVSPSPSATPSVTPSISASPSVTPSISVSPSITPSTSVSSSVTPTNNPPASKKNNTAVIAGIAVAGSVAVLALISGSVIFMWRTKHRRNNDGPQVEMSQVRDRNLTQVQDIEILTRIGSGNFGEVFKGKWQGTTDVALKKLRNKELQNEFFSEASVMQGLSMPNVVRFFGIFTDYEGYFYLVTEFMSRGCLLDVLRAETTSLQPKDLLQMSLDAAAGMKYIASKGVVHRDLATRNLLVKEEDNRLVVKVADFGLSRLLTSNYYSASGSPFPVKWSPPEVLTHEKYTSKSDVWSFGIVVWEIFSYGAVPYPGKSNEETMNAVLSGYRMPKPDACPDVIYELMLKCWKDQPEDRPDFHEIFTEIQAQVMKNYPKEGKDDETNNEKRLSSNNKQTEVYSVLPSQQQSQEPNYNSIVINTNNYNNGNNNNEDSSNYN